LSLVDSFKNGSAEEPQSFILFCRLQATSADVSFHEPANHSHVSCVCWPSTDILNLTIPLKRKRCERHRLTSRSV